MTDRRAGITRLRNVAPALRSLSDDELLIGLDRALDLWRAPGGYAERAARDLALHRGQSETMLRFGLDRLLAAHSLVALTSWLADARAEAGRIRALRHAQSPPPEFDRFRGPLVVAQVLAGNVAALAVPAGIEALLARSAVLLKPAEGDPSTPAFFKESLDRAAPALGEAVAVERWKGGDTAVEAEVFGAVDFVMASGDRSTLDSLSRRIEGSRSFRGPRVSIGMVGMDWMHAPAEWWGEVAREIALWDQEGCLSPRILFVAGDPERFARNLAPALAAWHARWPARRRTAQEASSVHAFRAPYEMAKPAHGGCIVPEDLAWTVVWDQAPSLILGPPARVVRVTLRPSPREFEALLASGRESLQAVGLDHLGPADLDWRRGVDRVGIPRIVPLTRIQDPPAGWWADGKSGLAELLAAGDPLE